MKIVNSDGLDKWTYLNNKYKSSYMLKRVFLEILKGSTGFEPVTVRDTSPYPVRYHFVLNLGGKKEKNVLKGGPGRNRTCDLADNGSIPARLQNQSIKFQ
jgi:hypothetical protein